MKTNQGKSAAKKWSLPLSGLLFLVLFASLGVFQGIALWGLQIAANSTEKTGQNVVLLALLFSLCACVFAICIVAALSVSKQKLLFWFSKKMLLIPLLIIGFIVMEVATLVAIELILPYVEPFQLFDFSSL